MAIITHLDMMLAKRKMASKELARRIGLSENNLSRIKTGNIKAIRWSTLEAICRELNCQPGDLLEYVPEPEAVMMAQSEPSDGDPVAASAVLRATAAVTG